MVVRDRVDGADLVEAGLAAMQAAGNPLSKLPSKGRAMLYGMPNGETVRVRTCNDHLLIVVADRADTNANLNIEGTDWLLVVMPEKERTPGSIVSYLIPTAEAIFEARRTHQEWLNSSPDTKGDNRTWNLWFRADGPGKANDYAAKWAKYRLSATPAIRAEAPAKSGPARQGGNIKDEVERARRRIAEVAGVAIEAVRITIDFG